MADAARQVLDFLFARMQIDQDWSVREPGAFTWWAGPLAQRVWAAPPRTVEDTSVTTVHIETDLLAGVPAGADTEARLAGVNRLATMSAYLGDLAEGRVRLHASVTVTDDNWPLARLLALHAMAIQVADAHAEAAPLAQVFGGTPDRSGHPGRGLREDRDEMLDVIEIYQQRGEGRSPFGAAELAGLVHAEPRPWLSIANTPDAVQADLPFGNDRPSRLELNAAARHPALGSGLHARLVIPVAPTPALVQRLNLAEREDPDAHQLGAWCLDEARGLTFASFVPTAAYSPNLAHALLYHMAARNSWAAAVTGA
ncbi:MAG: hypothetical protein AB1635_01370 [Acidobacteriota bacterium]